MLNRLINKSPLKTNLVARSFSSVATSDNKNEVSVGLPPYPHSKHLPSVLASHPLIAKSAKGCWIESENGMQLLDFTSGIGVTNLGHGHEKVNKNFILRTYDNHTLT